MQKAAFSIDKYVFNQVSINLDNNVSNELNIKFNTSGSYDKANSSFELVFSVTVYNDEKTIDNPFVFVQCVGSFKFENVNSFEEIPDFFYRNCIAILFPYLRAYVSVVTSQANVQGIILPTYNLSSLEGELRNNTIQK